MTNNRLSLYLKNEQWSIFAAGDLFDSLDFI